MELIAYCFMPDHVHLLIEGQSDASDCRRFISRAKQCAAYHFARMFGGRLWQRYTCERILRDDEHTLAIARYIVQNPVRAGLVQRVEEYPFAGSKVYSLSQLLDGISRSG